MIESLLIANRGEIACRIMRTCRRLGIRTIAVFSEADIDARYVALADAKYCIGPAEAARSYLRPDAIIEAALAHGADAIHPGYGFLSEKVELAELCRREGIVWVGPSPDCIAMMGSKIESKIIARRANVSGVPGYHGEDQSWECLLAEAHAIGFPVLIKASSGGGGKGMRRVDRPADFAPALDLVKREGKAAFGDDRVLLEKFITRPRHIEVQLAGDKQGNVLHLFERECSIQRNYQKIIEEAPAANLAAGTRQKLLEAAVRLGKAVGYDSLGTVEFILDADDPEPFFLEMNTRLQVEHPVTEMVTGLDLVELQLRIAAGEPLPFSQAEVKIRGWAIEARLNAEDPSAEFRPNVGRVGLYEEPVGDGIRVDSGIGPGSEVTPFYDSMLAKIIAFGPGRQAATRRLGAALDRLVILGVGTNQIFLRDILRLPKFLDEVLTTQFIPEAFPTGWDAPEPNSRIYAAAGAALVIEKRRGTWGAKESPWLSLTGFRIHASAGRSGCAKIQVRCGDRTPVVLDVAADEADKDAFLIKAGDPIVEDVRIMPMPDGYRLLVREGQALAQLYYLMDGNRVSVFEPGCGAFTLEAVPLVEAMANMAKAGETAGSFDVVAPMPGLITEIPVTVGQFLRKGDTAAVVESMKLAMRLFAPVDGAVSVIHCLPGETVAGGARIVGLEPATERPVA